MKRRILAAIFIFMMITIASCGTGGEAVLGGDFDADYDGFEYLSCVMLMPEFITNEETGKAEKQGINVFIPKGEFSDAGYDTAYADEAGVIVRITINPFMECDGKACTAEEKLAYYLEKEYDEYDNYAYRVLVDHTTYRDLEMSETKEAGRGVRATVRYCHYNKSEGGYYSCFCTYYLAQLSDNTEMLLEVMVDEERVKENTDALIAELEHFYGFDIDWDMQEAQRKGDNFLASGDADMAVFSTGYFLFELPLEWEENVKYDSLYSYSYAPHGNSAIFGCSINIGREYTGISRMDTDSLLMDTELLKSYLEEGLGVRNYEISDYGITCMGEAMKIIFNTADGEDESRTELYLIFGDDYIYHVQAIADSKCTEDVFALVEGILENGKLKER